MNANYDTLRLRRTAWSLNSNKDMQYFIFLLLLISQSAYADPLFYFYVGSSWTYIVNGKENYQVTNKVTEIKTVNEQNGYKLIEYGETFWVGNKEHGQVEAVNFFEENPSQISKAEELLVYKFPAKICETWGSSDSKMTYLGVKNIVVPASVFDCHMYNIDMGNGNYSKSCIAKDVGVVYNEAVLENSSKEVSKLLHYKQ